MSTNLKKNLALCNLFLYNTVLNMKTQMKGINTMKKLLAILLGALLLVSVAACKKTAEPSPAPIGAEEQTDETTDDVPGMISGGWSCTADPALTDDQKAIFDKALAELVGVNYVPLACLGTQVVAGINYCFLAQGTVVYPDATPSYKLVYIYADLTGGAEVMNIADLPIIPNEDGTASVPEEMLMGGWSYAEEYEITDELNGLLNKALDGMTSASYTAIAQVGTQVVAGLNHCLVCQVTPVVPDPESHYALVYLYEDLTGGAELTQVIDLNVGEFCTYGA